MKFPLKPFVAALALSLGAVPVMADMAAHLGPMAKVMKPGADGAWLIEDTDNWLTLKNATAPGAIQYYWMGVPDSQGPNYTVSVNLVTQTDTPATPAYAGLIFNYRAKDSYFGVTIGTDGKGYLFIRSPSGFKTHTEEKVQAKNDGSDVLTATVTGNKVTFELNGATFVSMDNPNGFSPKLGLMAIGQGLFGFTRFTIY
ncbi:hypothetical protein N4R57_18110 [Rhodobacteraceae bacterium D3-12]|nr:hypothetical protein N4R57_18110 [Rhodobacteraceae bacterium D3-12]